MWTFERAVRCGREIGPATAAVVTHILEHKSHPEQGYRSCFGLLSLAKRYTSHALPNLGLRRKAMTHEHASQMEEMSVFAIGTAILRRRRLIAIWAMAGGSAAVLSLLVSQALFLAFASFVPQSTDSNRSASAIVGLAGQFGVTLPGANPSLSSDFYVSLLHSHELLGRVVRDTIIVPELKGRRIAVLDLLDSSPGGIARRNDDGVRRLAKLISSTTDKKTGVVLVEVRTRWPSVSFNIVTALINGVNQFNSQSRQGQATAERIFLASRLSIATTELRESEDRLERFLQNNKQFATSAQLTFEYERLKRNVVLQQQVFTALTQSYEDARIREVRDSPTITMVESPAVSVDPEPRGRFKRILIGLAIGIFLGIIAALLAEIPARIRSEGDADGELFLGVLAEVRKNALRLFRVGAE